MTFVREIEYVTETCCYEGCGVAFAFTRAYYNQVRNDTNRWWYCPNGHRQHYTAGMSDAAKLHKAEAREVALRDQLEASAREAETVRQALLRDRQRFANGVCPCCNRSFENVRRHMATKHPDYDASRIQEHHVRYACSCGRDFETLNGLRIHQGRNRRGEWYAPTASAWRAHLTKVEALSS